MPPRRAISGLSQDPGQRFAEECRRLRLKKGLSFRELGEVMGWDASLFGKIESGATIGSPDVVQALDQYYETGVLLLTLWELAAGDPRKFRERYRRYMKFEEEAISLWHHAVSVLPGLLQTEGYARELLAAGGLTGDELESQVGARIGRRERLEGEMAPRFRTILSEAVLRTPLRDTAAWREQLEYLLELADRPNVMIQVLPFSVGLHGLNSTSMMFLRMQDGSTVAYTENAYRGELIEESSPVERLQLAYDAVRDLALTPPESRKFIMRMLEELPCDPST
ncbi:helix-turn-helix transcriptional regulator [Streptomyces sp. NBC_01525]|uniref:Helix-turn-helix domain-containing protein n=1 Tax=Streptomyces benahoarensis TaxID=2595054 RepID=A0A553Z029_9ACTN|nr:helix-turn-helix transcriptional regulator [Streptomyces benahoarensis]TSB20600.1 helix-turn-helix domain-containing protein [Streptomyces benahoarensis]TSB34791.1 helix-turn-helix domain-containing protein [Streptomyces benahoarensis]